LPRLVDELGDVLHGLVDRQLLQLGEDDQAEDQAERAHHQADRQQAPPSTPKKVTLLKSGRIRSFSLIGCRASAPPAGAANASALNT